MCMSEIFYCVEYLNITQTTPTHVNKLDDNELVPNKSYSLRVSIERFILKKKGNFLIKENEELSDVFFVFIVCG